jgi:hypothetical protein
VLGVPQVSALAEQAAEARAPVVGNLTLVFPEPRTLAMRAFPLADRGPTGRIVVTLDRHHPAPPAGGAAPRLRGQRLPRAEDAGGGSRALAETLLTALPDDPEAGRRFAERIGREAERLDVLARDLLDLSRVERGTLDVEPVDLVGLVKEVVGGYADRAEERRIRLRTELQPVAMRGDRAQLGLLLSNLLDNALRHTPAKGAVCVRLDAAESRAVLQVADTGEGIPAEGAVPGLRALLPGRQGQGPPDRRDRPRPGHRPPRRRGPRRHRPGRQRARPRVHLHRGPPGCGAPPPPRSDASPAPHAGKTEEREPTQGQAGLERPVLVGEHHLVAAGGHADPAQGVVDTEELGRAAVDLDPPLGVPGVAEHEQAVGVAADRHLDPGLVPPLDPDRRRAAPAGQAGQRPLDMARRSSG